MRYFFDPRVAILILACAGALSGCGRRGALELPPDVAARPKEAVVQRVETFPPGSKKPVVKEVVTEEYIPGVSGHRPPEQYPFPLDPLL